VAEAHLKPRLQLRGEAGGQRVDPENRAGRHPHEISTLNDQGSML
jgi:hypothetical protein